MTKEKTKRIKNILLKSLSAIIVIGTILFLAYYLFNTYIGETKLQEDFQAWAKENKALCYSLFLILTPLINIIPGISSIFFITLANAMFNDNTITGMLEAFGASIGSVMLSTVLLFLLGRWGGKRVVSWIIGEEDFNKAQKILTYGGKASLPFIYLFPFFPDDTMSFLCGMTNMSFLYNFICALIFRGIGVFTCCFFGTHLIPYEKFTAWQWALVVIGGLLILSAVLLCVVWYYRYLRKKEEGLHYVLTMGLKIKHKS